MTTDDIKQAGETTLERARTVASFIPSRFRALIYSLLATAMLLELIWDLIPAAIDGKVQASVNVLGFGMAALNTDTGPEQ